MEKKSYNLPAMYADHHVVEVRRILLGLPGVTDAYASSAFQVVEVTFDPDVVKEPEITEALEEAGYLGEFLVTTESGTPADSKNGDETFFRHTEIYEQTKETIGFAQNVSYVGRPLWPCPGIGVINTVEEEN
ncbi:MAG: heavy-metal-associated domain-containing protein [Anaerolineales bacterium]|jgi:copper chaperone CopZ